MTSMEQLSLDTWFTCEVLAHERELLRYLARMWSNHNDVQDLRQETYMRVYEAASKSRPHRPKAFLFATARHLMTDYMRRRKIVVIDAVEDMDSLNLMIEENSPEVCTAAHEELRQLAAALDALPPRCREVVWLRRVDNHSQKEVASRLGIAQKTVEKHVMNGMKLLARALRQPHLAQEVKD